MYELYCLIDPRYNSIAYIGFTSRSKYRLNEHLRIALNNYNSEYNSYKSKWIRKLKSLDLIPVYKTLIRTNSEQEIKLLEIEYIRFYKSFYKLKNGTLGGDGTKGRTPTERERLHLSQLYKGIIRLDLRYKVEILHSKSGEYKILKDKTEAARYIGCKENAIMCVSCGNRKKVYNWYVNLIKKGR